MTLARPVELIEGRVRGAVDDRTGNVVVPAVRVVVGDHDGGVRPDRRRLDRVDRIDQEALLVERTRVPGVTVLVCRRLEEGDRGDVAGVKRRCEVPDVVLVVYLRATAGRIVVAD